MSSETNPPQTADGEKLLLVKICAALQAILNGGGGGVTSWGGIVGNILNQTDLINYIAAHSGSSFSPANVVFVDANGDDTDGDGSPSKPWQTGQKAWDTVGNSKLIQLGDGYYTILNSSGQQVYVRGLGQSRTYLFVTGANGANGVTAVYIYPAAGLGTITGLTPNTLYTANVTSTPPDVTVAFPSFPVTTDGSGVADVTAAFLAAGNDAQYSSNYSGQDFIVDVDGQITVTGEYQSVVATAGGNGIGFTLFPSQLFLVNAAGGNAGQSGLNNGAPAFALGAPGDLSIYADNTVMAYTVSSGIGYDGPEHGTLILENIQCYGVTSSYLTMKNSTAYTVTLESPAVINDICNNGLAADASAGTGSGTNGGTSPSSNKFGILFYQMD